MENTFRLASSSVSDRGLSDKRPVNEDSFVEMSDLGLFAVADGVGGAQAGDVASQMSIEILSEAFANRRQTDDAEDVMRLAIESANKAIYQMSEEIPQLSSMATTIAAIHLNDNIATVAHVGDSRVYRVLPDGSLRRETADHSVVEEEVRAGRMSAQQALVHPSRNVISRALGADSTVDVELQTIMIEPGTVFLLCSDGITRHVSDRELEELFNHEIEPEVLVKRLREICYSRGAEDNLTAIVVRVTVPAETEFAEEFGEYLEHEDETIAGIRSRGLSDSLANPQPEETTVSGDNNALAEGAEKPDEQISRVFEPNRIASDSASDSRIDTHNDSIPPVSIDHSGSHVDTEIRLPVFAQAPDESRKSSAVSRGIKAFALLLLGAAAGVAGSYFWHQNIPPPTVPVFTETKSNNIPLTAFEEGRREVDRDPDRYLLAKAASPQDAEDHYLLGRAQLLTGKYVEAMRQFALAKERLPQVDPANSKTLEAEIALARALVSTPEACEAFVKEITSPGSAVQNRNVNSNNAVPPVANP